MAQPWEDFDACCFLPSVQKALRSLGFEKPTTVQSHSWPVIVPGADVIGVSATGSGKTLAFLVPAINSLLQQPFALKRGRALAYPRLLVLAPTMELASQIHDEGQRLATCLRSKLRSAAFYGGVRSE